MAEDSVWVELDYWPWNTNSSLCSLFCSTSMPLTSTRWVQLTFSSLCPLYYKQHCQKKSQRHWTIPKKFLGECWESNPGEKQECFLCAMQPTLKSFFILCRVLQRQDGAVRQGGPLHADGAPRLWAEPLRRQPAHRGRALPRPPELPHVSQKVTFGYIWSKEAHYLWSKSSVSDVWSESKRWVMIAFIWLPTVQESKHSFYTNL